MSMIAKNKAEKLMACEVMLQHLWVGNAEAVLLYLATFVPKNQEKYQELLKYLKKHQSEIINYQLRQGVGKSMGSGRMEKGVDTVIGQRQKHKAMSWSRTGSKSLAIVKSYRLNSGVDSPF